MKVDLGGLEVDLCTIRQRLILPCFPCVFLMMLVFGEQKCDFRESFKAKLDIEDATSRGGTFGGSTGAPNREIS